MGWDGLTKFKHKFSNCVNPSCFCSLEAESTIYFFQHCLCFSNTHKILFNELNTTCHNFADLSDSSKVD